MTRSLLARLILICLIVVVLALTVRIATEHGKSNVPDLDDGSVSSSPMTIRGFGFSTYVDDRLSTRVSAGLFRIRPRKLGIFKVRSLNEVALSKARFEIHPDHPDGGGEGKSAESVLGSIGSQFTSRTRELTGMKGVGNITRAVMDGMELAFFRQKSPRIQVRAQKGEMDFKKKEVRMEHALLEHLPSKKKIAASTIIWDDEARLFTIPGKYRAQTPGGQASGRGITVDLDFRVEKLPLVSNRRPE
jgi:hypothetical protein